MDKITINRVYEGNKADGYATISFKRDGNKEFRISFCGNLDLYFTLNNFDKDPTFYIGIDNYALFNIFDTLYNDIMNGIVFSDTFMFDEDDYQEKIERQERYRKSALDLAHETGLIDDNSIVWISDDYPKDVAPYFKIDKLANAYKITFLINTSNRVLHGEERYALNDYKDGFTTVRIRNDGSSYQMFNVPFMKAYNALLDMELLTPQIHIAEYMLDKTLETGKSLEHILKLEKDISNNAFFHFLRYIFLKYLGSLSINS